MTTDRNITVYAESTPNPNSMKFVMNCMLLPNESVDFRNISDAVNSPFAQELFKFPYVIGVFIMNNFVSINKTEDVEWIEVTIELREFIKKYVDEGKIIIEPKQELTVEEENEVIQKIKKLLDDHVKPAVEMDGGAIDFIDFSDGIVTVSMKGACSGCPSSTLTLKAGIENLLKRMVPEVQAVEAEMG